MAMTQEGAITLLRLAICDSKFAIRTGRPQPIFGMRSHELKPDVKIFVIDEETHDIRDISGIVATALNLQWNDKTGFIRVNCGYCPTTYIAEALSTAIGVKHIPGKTL